MPGCLPVRAQSQQSNQLVFVAANSSTCPANACHQVVRLNLLLVMDQLKEQKHRIFPTPLPSPAWSLYFGVPFVIGDCWESSFHTSRNVPGLKTSCPTSLPRAPWKTEKTRTSSLKCAWQWDVLWSHRSGSQMPQTGQLVVSPGEDPQKLLPLSWWCHGSWLFPPRCPAICLCASAVQQQMLWDNQNTPCWPCGERALYTCSHPPWIQKTEQLMQQAVVCTAAGCR